MTLGHQLHEWINIDVNSMFYFFSLETTREVYYKIPVYLKVILYSIAALAVIVIVWRFVKLVKNWMLGQADIVETDSTWKAILGLIKRVLGGLKDTKRIKTLLGGKIFKDSKYKFLMHSLIMWSILTLFAGTILVTIHEYSSLIFNYTRIYTGVVYLAASFILDLASLTLLAGIIMAFAVRLFNKKYYENTLAEDGLLLLFLLLIDLFGILLEAFRMIAWSLLESQPIPSFETWSFVGYALANWILTTFTLDASSTFGWYLATWTIHMLLAFGTLIYLPFTKLFHIVLLSLNVLASPEQTPARLRSYEEGLEKIGDFTFSQLMQLDACVRCHKCHNACPANISGEPLSPMMAILDLKQVLHSSNGNSSVTVHGENTGITPDVLWACTTCMACVESCPAMIQHVDLLVGLRSYLIGEGTEVPSMLIDMLESVERYGNLWGQPPAKRDAWSKDLELKHVKDTTSKLLLYVGDTASYDPRAQKVAKALVKILTAAGVEFGVLGNEEKNDGDTVRRVGEDLLFQMMAEENIGLFKKYGIKKIITISPHSYNAFKNEYKDVDPDFNIEVVHYTEFLEQLVKEGKIKISKEISTKVTYHDPCYLGRYNNEYDAPRDLLKFIPGVELVEMKASKDKALCCGGGGGGMFRESKTETRINQIRARQAAETGANILAVACPFCLSMLTDGVKTTGVDKQLEVKDILEIILEAMNIEI